MVKAEDRTHSSGLQGNIQALKDLDIALLVVGTILNSAGNIVYNIGIAWLAYDLTN